MTSNSQCRNYYCCVKYLRVDSSCLELGEQSLFGLNLLEVEFVHLSLRWGRHVLARHRDAQVHRVSISAGLSEAVLVGAAVVLARGVALLDGARLVLEVLVGDVVEVHALKRNVWDHVIVVHNAVEVWELRAGVGGEVLVSNTWGANVVHSHIVFVSLQVKRGEGGQGSSEAVAGGDHLLGTLLLGESGNLHEHLVQDGLLGLVESLVNQAAAAKWVGVISLDELIITHGLSLRTSSVEWGEQYLKVGDPVLQALRSSEHDVDLFSAWKVTNVPVGISLAVVEHLGSLKTAGRASPRSGQVGL